jgi:hypothetical protein
MANPTLPDDPVELVRRLDPAVIRRRLQEMEEERAALLVLLRAAMRARPNAPLDDPPREEAADVS